MRRIKDSDYSDVTPESLKEMYPTQDWPLRFVNAVRRE